MTSPTREFEISKKLLSDYIIKSLGPSPENYAVQIARHRSTEKPFMFLHEGTSSKDVTTVVGSVCRLPEQPAFEIVCSSSKVGGDLASSVILKRSAFHNGDMEVNLKDGEPRELAWRLALGSGASGTLVDIKDPKKVLARFNQASMTRSGLLNLNVHWGSDFDKVVFMSLITLFEKTSFWGRSYSVKRSDLSLTKARNPYPSSEYDMYRNYGARANNFVVLGGGGGCGGC